MKWLVTGGCGFIGTNVVEQLIRDGHEPVVFDNVSRPRVHRNLSYLRDELGVNVDVADVRDKAAVNRFFGQHPDADVVLHLAGQVSFMASLSDPRSDFEINALGTLNVVDAAIRRTPDAPCSSARPTRFTEPSKSCRPKKGPPGTSFPTTPTAYRRACRCVHPADTPSAR